jgi:hypothetical protein
MTHRRAEALRAMAVAGWVVGALLAGVLVFGLAAVRMAGLCSRKEEAAAQRRKPSPTTELL